MNIERNLYLTLQVLEMRVPTVIALNMMDEVRANGGTVDILKLSEELGVPVVPISAAKNEGIEELINTAYETAKAKTLPKRIDFLRTGAGAPLHPRGNAPHRGPRGNGGHRRALCRHEDGGRR